MSEQRRNPPAVAEEPAAVDEGTFSSSSSEPRSFKLDRNSPLAAKLKTTVSDKLLQFLGNYTDDVLAEYIVVLVCNGKHQSQARADLEAFLGDESGKFVAWLWNHLSEEIYLPKATLDSSSFKINLSTGHNDIIPKDHKTVRLAGSHINSAATADIPMSMDGNFEPSNFSTNISKTIEEPDSLQRWCPSTDAETEFDTGIPHKQTFASHKDSGAPDYNCSGIAEYPPRVRCSPDSSSGRDHCLRYENQVQKIIRSNSSAVTCQPLPVLKTEPVSRNLRSVIAEEHQSKRLSVLNAVRGRLPSTAMDAVQHKTAQPRGNVWDRLGKPCNEDDGFRRQNQCQQRFDVLEREKLVHNGEGHTKHRSVQAVSDPVLNREKTAYDSYGRVISNNHSGKYVIQDHDFHTLSTLDHTDNSKRKKLFGEFSSGDSSASSSGRKENLVQFKQAFSKTQGSLPVKNNLSQNLKNFSSELKDSTAFIPEVACHPFKSSSRRSDLESDGMLQHQLNRKASVKIPMQNLVQSSKTESVMSEPVCDAVEAKTKHGPMQDEVTIVKSRLRQIEMDMHILRSKHAVMDVEGKLNASSGSQNHSDEDIESRTVLVTNVHFAATREALLQHFTKCGTVLKVILLTDTVTAQPKGAAYIVFASKDSIDSALAMSGTSFFSRILTVMQKADMPPGFLVPSQLVGKIPQLPYPQSFKKGSSVHRPYTTSPHLQWTRQLPASGENSISAPNNGLGSSSTGE